MLCVNLHVRTLNIDSGNAVQKSSLVTQGNLTHVLVVIMKTVIQEDVEVAALLVMLVLRGAFLLGYRVLGGSVLLHALRSHTDSSIAGSEGGPILQVDSGSRLIPGSQSPRKTGSQSPRETQESSNEASSAKAKPPRKNCDSIIDVAYNL